jgi:Tfp pilus assembly protein PilX
MRLRLARGEDGYTMIAVVGAIALVTLLVGAALAATNADLGLVRRDISDKRAYAAAQAGIADYSFHLNNDNYYWSRCTNVPVPTGEPTHAVNLEGSTTNRRKVPGVTDASYSIELLHASNTTNQCNSSSPPLYNMLEQSGSNTGSFRIRVTGYVGSNKQAVVVTYKRASLLDFLYFTQLETSDPVTYGYANPSPELTGAYSQCTKYIRTGRYSQPIPNTSNYCDKIVFVDADDLDGPLHTNDALVLCGTPDFGRSSADVIEVSAPLPGWYTSSQIPPGGGCTQASPNFLGPFVTNAPVLTPPPTNGQLKTIAGPAFTYTGATDIALNGTSMTITKSTGQVVGPISFPTAGVIYVANGTCATSYSPFTATYPTNSGCGNVRVSGSYSGQLTIAAENDVIIDGNITRTSTGLLGLVANNFVRVYHPYPNQTLTACNGNTGEVRLTNLTIDAAILAIDHSFIVDHYNCGASMGTLTVNGAIAQKFRGAVGTTGGTGYTKDYNYDDRLRYQEPPSFLDPVQSAWHVQRATLDFSGP